MSYSNQQLKQIAQTNPQELVRIINGHYSSDIKTIALAVDILGEEVSDEAIVLPIIRRFLKHVHVLIRESAITCAGTFYMGKTLPEDIADRLKIIVKADPSNDLKDLAEDTLKDFKR